MLDKNAQIVRFKMRVVDCDMTEPTLSRIRMNSIPDTDPQTEGGKYVAGEPQNAIRFHIKDPVVAALFVEGQDYYVDFTATFQEVGSNDGE